MTFAVTSTLRRTAAAFGAAVLAGALTLGMADTVRAAGKAPAAPSQDWSFSGPFGTFDRGQLQRGFQVYKQVCASCHAMSLVKYRNLSQPGGPGFTEEQVKVIAADYTVMDGPDEFGDMFEREAKPFDAFVSPFENEQQARASNNGAYPLDLSVIAKARKNGANYLYALLTGYTDPPAGEELREGMYYNTYFPGHQIAMAPPLFEEGVEYTDGSPMTIEQYAADVTAFLMWTAEPKLEDRKKLGFQVMLFLLVFAGLLYLSKKKLWANLEH